MSNQTVPLFLLKSVLLPHMPLRLHVFEERYKQMINKCIENRQQFGVVLIHEGEEVGPTATPESVGCLARIIAVQNLPEGRLNLFAEGTERIRLLDYLEHPIVSPLSRSKAGADQGNQADHYLVGITEQIVDHPASCDETSSQVVDIMRYFNKYFQILVEFAGIEMPDYELPTTPVELSFVIAAVVQMDTNERQQLLEMTDTAQRLERERTILRRELRRLRKLTQKKISIAERLDLSELRRHYSPN